MSVQEITARVETCLTKLCAVASLVRPGSSGGYPKCFTVVLHATDGRADAAVLGYVIEKAVEMTKRAGFNISVDYVRLRPNGYAEVTLLVLRDSREDRDRDRRQAQEAVLHESRQDRERERRQAQEFVTQ
jgi:hypothetical protein